MQLQIETGKFGKINQNFIICKHEGKVMHWVDKVLMTEWNGYLIKWERGRN